MDFENIYKESLKESGNADFFQKNWARVKGESTLKKKAQKLVNNFLLGSSFWDDVLEKFSDFINEPGISTVEHMKRQNEILSSFRNFNKLAPMYSEDDIKEAEGEENG
jgi:hypothetical protein